MVSKLKSVALAGALAFVAAPAFAQQGVPVVGDLPIITDLPIVGNTGGGIDLDPLHIFTPAPAAPAPVVVRHHVHHHVHHHVVHHHVHHHGAKKKK